MQWPDLVNSMNNEKEQANFSFHHKHILIFNLFCTKHLKASLVSAPVHLYSTHSTFINRTSSTFRFHSIKVHPSVSPTVQPSVSPTVHLSISLTEWQHNHLYLILLLLAMMEQ